jgi:hypothetical protein
MILSLALQEPQRRMGLRRKKRKRQQGQAGDVVRSFIRGAKTILCKISQVELNTSQRGTRPFKKCYNTQTATPTTRALVTSATLRRSRAAMGRRLGDAFDRAVNTISRQCTYKQSRAQERAPMPNHWVQVIAMLRTMSHWQLLQLIPRVVAAFFLIPDNLCVSLTCLRQKAASPLTQRTLFIM